MTVDVQVLCDKLYEVMEPLRNHPQYVPWRRFVPDLCGGNELIAELHGGEVVRIHTVSSIQALLANYESGGF